MKRNLNIKIAFWYYTLGMTQDEIAKRLNLTRQKVNQIIRSLGDQEIVSINIHGYERDDIELENRMEEKYGLNEVLVVDDYGDQENALYKVANVASQYLDEVIVQGDIIGVAWGRTLAEVLKQMPFRKKDKCQVVQLIGAQDMGSKILKQDATANELANHLDCASYMLNAPIVVENPETKAWLMKEKSIKASFARMKCCNVAVFGIGELAEQSTMTIRGHLSPEDLKILEEHGFVGDICMNPVRADGSYDNCPISNRILSLDIESLKDINNTIAIVVGKGKIAAIRAVLNSHCVNTLIIDKTSAKKLMDEE